ncbi:MAG TPA: hypothetical protein VK824_11055, partial [Planctomycetota bacterium]|nr:hypothetical protein [Planctomycetota bacterium]
RFSVTQQDLVASPEVPSTVLSPLTLAPDGRLLGALAADVNGLPSHILQLLEFDVPDGQVSPPPEVLAQVACSVTFGPDGNQYFVQESGSQVSVRTPGGSDIALIGIDADLELPRDLRFGPDGHLYIASFGSGLVEVIDTTGAHVATIGADAPLDGPTRLAFSPRRFHAKLSGKSVGATGASVNLKADAVVSFTPGQATLMLLVENDLADQDDFASLYGGTLVFSGHQAAGEDPKTRRLAVACMSNVPLQAGFGVADLTLKGKLDEGGRFVPAKASGSFLRAAAGHVFTGKLSTGKLIK